MIKSSLVPVAGGKMKGTYHTTYTPSDEAAICLNCDLPECKKTNCKRFKEEKKKLRRRE